jgi:hypothetical protein
MKSAVIFGILSMLSVNARPSNGADLSFGIESLEFPQPIHQVKALEAEDVDDSLTDDTEDLGYLRFVPVDDDNISVLSEFYGEYELLDKELDAGVPTKWTNKGSTNDFSKKPEWKKEAEKWLSESKVQVHQLRLKLGKSSQPNENLK